MVAGLLLRVGAPIALGCLLVFAGIYHEKKSSKLALAKQLELTQIEFQNTLDTREQEFQEELNNYSRQVEEQLQHNKNTRKVAEDIIRANEELEGLIDELQTGKNIESLNTDICLGDGYFRLLDEAGNKVNESLN